MAENSYKNFTAGLFGNALEWYDFILYAYFAPLFSSLFFPTNNQYTALLATFGIFASGFFARPLGGFLLGLYGDSSGRKSALVASILIMTGSTLLIAFLPTYATLGYWSPILLTLLRILQGIAVGGELTSSATFLVEHANDNWRGFSGSLILSTAFLGMVVGSAITTLLSIFLSQQSMMIWGWRFAYLLGGALGILGTYLRIKRSKETPYFVKISHHKSKVIKNIFTFYRKELILSFIFTSVMALGNYILIAYVTTFLVKFKNFTFEAAMLINFCSLLLLTLLIPIFGFLSDKLGRKKVLAIGLASSIVFTLPIFWLLIKGNFVYALISELLLAFVMASFNAVVPVLLVEILPTNIRATGSSIAYNSSQAIFGGTAPLVSLMLIELSGNEFAPGFYLLFCTMIAIFAIVHVKETYKTSLIDIKECPVE